MRIACSLDAGRSLEEAVERVRLAESLGYESVWTTHIARREPLQVLGHYARHTERIGLGVGVVPIVLRHPALLAMEAATLDEISGGRLRLGIGVSHKVTVEGWYGLSLDDPVGRMREYATIVRSLLRTGSSGLEGRHYTSRFSFLGYAARPDLPLLFAALGPKMLALAGELADGVVLWMTSPTYIREVVVPALRAHRGSLDGFEIVANVPVALGDEAAGRGAIRGRVLPYAQLPFYRAAIAEGGHAEDLAAFDAALGGGDQQAAARALPDSFVDDFGAVGSAERLRAKIDEYQDAGATLVNVAPATRFEGEVGLEATLEALAP